MFVSIGRLLNCLGIVFSIRSLIESGSFCDCKRIWLGKFIFDSHALVVTCFLFDFQLNFELGL